MDTSVIVLAAGDSRRMGHPKALSRLGAGETALARIVATCAEAGLPRPVVVVGRHAAQVREAHPALDVDWVVNPDPDAGRTGSLRLALVHAQPARALVWPVDHPLARGKTVRLLLSQNAPLAVPVHDGRGGHPILLSGAAIGEALALPPDAPLRDLFQRDPARVARVRVDDAGILLNLDTPEDLARALRE